MSIDPQLLDSGAEKGVREVVNTSFEEIVRTYQADVRILVRRHFRDGSEADEVAQEVFVQVYRGLSGFRGDSSLRKWILGITQNQIRLHIRNETRRRRRSAMMLPPDLLDPQAAVQDVDPFQTESAESELDALQDCLTRLGERQRWLVESFYFRKQTAEFLATEMSLTAGAVRMMLMRIRKQLAECVRRKVTLRGEGDI